LPVGPDSFLRNRGDSNSVSSGSACGSGIEIPNNSASECLGISPSRVTINPEDYLAMKASPRSDDSHLAHRLTTVDTRRACRTTPRCPTKPVSVPPLSFQSSSAAAIAALTAAAAAATGSSTSRSMIAESPLSSCRDISALSPVSSPSSNEPSPLVQTAENQEMLFVEASQPVFSVDGPKDRVSATMFEGARKETFYLLSVDFFPTWVNQTQQKMGAQGKSDVPIPKNLATVLANEYWLKSFDQFLTSQFAVENLRFYQEATKYLETEFSSTEMMELDAQKIFLRFIAPGSVEQINTSAEICHQLCRVLFHKELEEVMEEQRTRQEQLTALNGLRKSPSSGGKKSGKNSSGKNTPIKQSESFGSEHELDMMTASSYEEEPSTPSKRRSGLFRSISHFSLHWKRTSDSENNTGAKTSRTTSKGDSSEFEVPTPITAQPGALKNTHSYSTTNLAQYQQQHLQRVPDLPVQQQSPVMWTKVHRTRSASMGLNFLGADSHQRKGLAARRQFDLSTSDSLTNSSQPASVTNSLSSPSSGQSDSCVSTPDHHHHHHHSSSLSSRRRGHHSECCPPPLDVSKKTSSYHGTPQTPPVSPSSPSSHKKPSSLQPSPAQVQASPKPDSTPPQVHHSSGHSSHSVHRSNHKSSSSKNTPVNAAVAVDSDLTNSQVVGQSPPVLPERLPLHDAAKVTPSKKHHKNKTTPRGASSPMADPNSTDISVIATPRTGHSHTKNGRKSSKQKSHSKRSKDAQAVADSTSFRRSGSTHSLDEVISVSVSCDDDSRNSFRLLEEGGDNAGTNNSTAPPHSFRKGSSGNGGFRRGSYDSSEARKPSYSFSSSEALSDIILSIDSGTSEESTPKVSLTHPDPRS